MTAWSLLATEAPAAALFFTDDPARSPLWPSMEKAYLGGLPVVFDDRVTVVLPPVTEDQTQVPVTADARALGPGVEELLVIADLNPFPLTVRLEPLRARPFVALRMKVEMGTAIHVAALVDGRWHVGGRYLDAAGGGCSVKPVGEARADLSSVGEMRGRLWPDGPTSARVRLRISHPMDNGMIGNAPPYFIETVTLSDPAGETLARVAFSEAVSADPTLTLLVDDPTRSGRITVRARDNNGGDFRGEIVRSDGDLSAIERENLR